MVKVSKKYLVRIIKEELDNLLEVGEDEVKKYRITQAKTKYGVTNDQEAEDLANIEDEAEKMQNQKLSPDAIQKYMQDKIDKNKLDAIRRNKNPEDQKFVDLFRNIKK